MATTSIVVSIILAFLSKHLVHAFTPSSVAATHSSSSVLSLSKLKMASDPEPMSLQPKETAIVFIEYQNEFTSPGGKLYEAVKPCLDKTNMLENSVNLMKAARAAGCTIIHCPIAFEPGHNEIAKNPYGILAAIKGGEAFTNGEWNSEFYPDMRPEKGDLVVKGKSGLCSFMSTNLDFLLSQNGIKNVVLGGFLANCCVESTMRTGYEKGYKVYTLKDCIAATSIEAMDATVEYNFGMFSVVTTSTEIMNALSVPIAA